MILGARSRYIEYNAGIQDNTLLLLATRLADNAPLENANGLLGVLAPLPSTLSNDGTLLYHGEVLALLNRLGGVRLQAHTDSEGVRCIATKTGGGVRLVLWREDRDKKGLLGLLHLKGISGSGYLRMENVTAHYGADPDAAVSSVRRDGNRNGSVGAARVSGFRADIKTENGEAEVAIPIEPSSAALITLQPRQPPPVEITLSTNHGPFFFGETLELDALVRNTSRVPQKADIELLGGGAAPVNGLKGDLGTLAPGASGRLRFRPIITGRREGIAYLNVRTSNDSQAALAVEVLSPVAATLLTPRLDLDGAGVAGQAHIRLVNRTHGTMSLLLRTDRNGRTEEQSVELAPDGKYVEQAVAVSAPSRDPGCYPVEIGIDSAGGRIATLTPLVGVPIMCRYATLKPTIDGVLSEWADSEPMGMGRADQVHDKTWRGPTDLSGYAYAQWDEQFLYIACAVTDDVFLASYPAAELWRGDSVQFAFSTNRASIPNSAGFGLGDHEFGMALLDGAHPVLYRFFGPGALKPGMMKRGAVAVRREGTRTFYEAAVPWTELAPARPAVGAAFGFSVLINDNDGQGRGYISWSEGMAPDKRPMLFPPLRLVR